MRSNYFLLYAIKLPLYKEAIIKFIPASYRLMQCNLVLQ